MACFPQCLLVGTDTPPSNGLLKPKTKGLPVKSLQMNDLAFLRRLALALGATWLGKLRLRENVVGGIVTGRSSRKPLGRKGSSRKKREELRVGVAQARRTGAETPECRVGRHRRGRGFGHRRRE